MSKVIRVLVLIMFALISVTSGVQGLSVIGDRYTDAVQSYPTSGSQFFLGDVSDDMSAEVQATLVEYTDRYGAVIFRRDDVLSQADGSVEGARFGVYGDVKKQADSLELSFVGIRLLDSDKLSLLLSSDPKSTLGLDMNSADMIADVPSVRFFSRLTVMQLQRLIDDSGTVNGAYTVVGLSPDQFQELLAQLSEQTGISTERLLHPLGGVFSYDFYVAHYATVFGLGAVVFTALIVFLAAFLGVNRYGIYLLLGWSKWAYIAKLNLPFVLGALAISLIPAGIIIGGISGAGLTMQLAGVVAVQMLKFLFLAFLTLVPGALALALIKPVAAIRNQVSRKALLALMLILFTGSSVGAVGAFYSVDGPLQEMREMQAIHNQWAKYGDYEILYREYVGDDSNSFTGQSSEHIADVYAWYASIEDKPGVNLAHTVFYSGDVLQKWQGAFSAVPSKPFWYMAASASYLRSINFALPERDAQLAQEGVRIYYVPDTLSGHDRESLEAWLREDALKDRGDSIVTAFMKNPRIEFRSYTPSDQIFMWNADLSYDFQVSDPVIYLAAAANMTPFESESLNAVGLQANYIKLSASAADRYVSPSYLATYHLDDNSPEFRSVGDFIAGLRKSIMEFIVLFGVVGVFIVALELALLMVIVSLYAKVYAQQVAIKRLLGYPLYSIFALPCAFVAVVSVGSFLLALILGSNSAILVSGVLILVQLLLLAWQSRRLATKQVAITVKEQ